LGVAEVQQRAVQEPVGMVQRQPALAVAYALRLEPDDELLALLMQPIAEGATASRVALRVRFPSAGIRPTALAGIPAGIAPAQVEGNIRSLELLHGIEQVLLAAFLERAITLHLHHRGWELAVEAGNIMGQEPAPPKVLRPDRIRAFPKQRGNQRRADFLARLQEQMRHLLARDNAQTALVV